GVNAYGTVALLGILGRAGVGEVPEPLTGTPVIAVALTLYAVEFVIDKIPYLDSTWDVVSTPVRPAIASAIGSLFAADVADMHGTEEVLGGGGAGARALTSHGIKAALRLGINASPEPVTNIVTSLTEDGLVALVIALTLQHPFAALAIVVILLAVGITIV